MEYYDKKSSDENLVEAFEKDILGRTSEMITFLRILDKVDDNYTISLDAPWGSGKTFFVKQAKLILDGLNPIISGGDDSTKSKDPRKRMALKYYNATSGRTDWELPESHLAIYFDAWAYDDYDEPVLALLYSIINQLDLSKDDLTRFKILPIITSLVTIRSGKDLKTFVDSLRPEDLLEDVKKRAGIRGKINDFLSEITNEKGNRCDIFIDELDRCNPVFAVKLLERIKHYFTSDRITFVFSTNLKELISTIKAQYGSNFDAERYLDRFFDIRLSLHKPQDIREYLLTLGVEGSRIEDEIMIEMIDLCNFSLREVNHYVRAVHIANGMNRNYRYASDSSNIIHQIIVPIVIGLKLWNSQELDKFLDCNNEALFFKFADRYMDSSTIQSLADNVAASKDAIVARKRIFNEVYHSLFPIPNLKEYGARGKKIGRVTFGYQNIDDLMETVDILSGTPDISKV